MKIVTVLDEEKYIVPLEFGKSIVVVDDTSKEITEYDNPGFGAMHGGKERAMSGILTLNPDAIVVKEGTLCPGSYFMSRGKMKYIPTEHEKFEDVLRNINSEKEKAVTELQPLMYQE